MAKKKGKAMKMSKAAFERSGKDIEKYPEGSKKDIAMDKKQMAALKKARKK